MKFLALAVATHACRRLVRVAVQAQLMSCVDDSPDRFGKAFGNPARHEEGGAEVRRVQKPQDFWHPAPDVVEAL